MLSVAIVTRNAVHGGVETMIALHQRLLKAEVFVAGEINRPDVCPFTYTFIESSDAMRARRRLREALRAYDVIIYHYLPTWAVEAVHDAKRPSIEFVHRADTSGNDKAMPTLLITHSEYLAKFLFKECGREALVIPHAIDLDRFKPSYSGQYIGSITSYLLHKGIDTALRAWSLIYEQFPGQRVRFYGAGPDEEALHAVVNELNLPMIEFRETVIRPEDVLPSFKLFIHPARVEGLPFAVLEALACNVPVITTDLDGMVELNAKAARLGFPQPLFLVRNGDIKGLSECIAHFLRGEIRMPETRPFIEEQFDLENHARILWRAIFMALQLYRPRMTVPVAPALP